MQPMLAVKYDDKALKQLARQARGIKGGLARVAAPALNRVNNWSRTQIKRQLARGLKVKQKRANKMIRIRKASRAHLSAEAAFENRRVGIAKFVQGRRRKRRVTAVFPSGLTQSYPHHFRATMPSGHKGIFVRARVIKSYVRIRRPKRGGYRTELPIYEQRERIGTIIETDFLQPIQRAGAQRLRREIASKIQWQLARARGR